jgi:hypothetical protein
MPRFLTIAALLLVVACSRPADQSAEAANDVAATAREPERASTPLLEGEWQLTKVDGSPIDGGSTVVATFGGGTVRVAAGCLRRTWSFTQKRNIVSFAADPNGSANCEVSPTTDQEAAFHALDRATMAIFDKQGREANLSGNGGNVTLVRR